MDKKDLEEYVNLKKEIAYLEEKLEALKMVGWVEKIHGTML